MNILINLYTYNVGGGKIIRDALLKHELTKNNCFVLANKQYIDSVPSSVKLVEVPGIFRLSYFLIHFIYIPYFIRKNKIQKVLNFSDIPLKTDSYQFYYFDWPYAVYTDSEIWRMMGIKSRIIRNIKLRIWLALIESVDTVIVQTEVIKSRLKKQFPTSNIKIIVPGADLNPNTKVNHRINRKVRSELSLIYPTAYYPHKNIERLIQVCEEIDNQKLSINIQITIEIDLGERLVKKIGLQCTPASLEFIGWKNRDELSLLYEDCDGLIMPTLLETFGLPYVEAMAYRKLVFTSNLDFARGLVGDYGVYFDPLNVHDIVQSLKTYCSEKKDDDPKNNYNDSSLVFKSMRDSIGELWKYVLQN